MHILLELPQDVPITRYELGLIRQIEFYDGHMNFFNGHCWFQGSGYEDTRPVSNYADLKLLNKQNLIVTADLPGSVDEASILEICPHAEFHYFSE